MLNLAGVDRAFDGIGALVGNQRPLVRIALKYWWLAIPAGLALYARVREHRTKNTLNAFNVATDVGIVLSPVIGIITLAEIVGRQYTAAPSILQPAVPVKDAEFTQTPAEQGAQHV